MSSRKKNAHKHSASKLKRRVKTPALQIIKLNKPIDFEYSILFIDVNNVPGDIHYALKLTK